MNWSNFPDFNEKEFFIGDPPYPGVMNEDFMSKLQAARTIAGVPFEINSGFRTTEHNQQVGGKPDSTHLLGRACDIKVVDSRTRINIVKSLLLAGFTRIGIGKDFVHVDNGEEVGKPYDPNVMWTYYPET